MYSIILKLWELMVQEILIYFFHQLNLKLKKKSILCVGIEKHTLTNFGMD